MNARTWPIWIGVAGIIIVVFAMAGLVAGAVFDGAAQANHTTLQEPLQRGLRLSFLLISLGALWRLRWPHSLPWRWAAGAALAILAFGVGGEFAATFASEDWIAGISASLGAADSLERRLFRLGSMAAFAVPMLALLAAGEDKHAAVPKERRLSARIAALLVRWEPYLFAIGVSTLATMLLAAAFVNKEFTWLSPIGSDTTVAACVAATIRARWRADHLAFGGWLLVCISLAIGLFMGAYSFGGPIPTPSIIGDYNALPRMILRDVHVMLIASGIAGIAIAAARKPQEGAG